MADLAWKARWEHMTGCELVAKFKDAARAFPTLPLYLWHRPATAGGAWGELLIAPFAPGGPRFELTVAERLNGIPVEQLPLRLKDVLRRLPLIGND